MLGAADVRIIFITAEGQAHSAPTSPTFTLGQPGVRRRHRPARVARCAPSSPRRASATGSRPCRPSSGAGAVLAQPLAAQRPDAAASSAGCSSSSAALGVLAALLAGWLVARNGLRPVRRLTPSVEQIAVHRGPDAAARSRATTRSPASPRRSTRCCSRSAPPATASAGWSPTPATSCVRRSPRCAPTSTCSARPRATPRCPPEARLELLDDVRGQIEELSALVGDLVELARDEPTTRVVGEVDLADVVERAVTRVRRRAPGRPSTSTSTRGGSSATPAASSAR